MDRASKICTRGEISHALCTQRLGTDCWWQQVGCTLRPGPEHVCRARLRTQSPVGRIPGIPRYSTRVGVEYAVCPARKCLFREFSRPATSVADGRALQPGNLTSQMSLRVGDDRPLAARRRALPCSPLAADRSLSRTPSSKAARRTPLSASGPSGVSFLSLRRPPVPERVGPEARFLRGGEPDRFSPLARRHSPLASTFATDALALAPPSKSPPPPSPTPSPTTRSSKGFVRRKLALIYTPAVAASAGLTVGA